MKFRNLILGIMFSALIIGCEKEKNLGTPDLTLGNDKLSFEKEEGTQTVTVTATRDWTVETDADWLTVSPASGKASADPVTVEISVLANEGTDRNAKLEFSIGMVSKTLTVSQKGAIKKTYTTIASIREKAPASEGEEVAFGDDDIVRGVVVSNKALDNLNSNKIAYVQDETGGVLFFFSNNHSYNFGDEVEISLKGQKMSLYEGGLQISGVPNENVTVLSEGNEVAPKDVTVEDFMAGKVEGQYVAIPDVQVASSDLEKTFVMNESATSIEIETKDGQTFEVRSGKYSSFGSTKVPQGAGKIMGIASVFNSTIQIYFAQESDFAGLTGERFEGVPAVPMTVSQIYEASNGAKLETSGIVAAIYEKGFILKDDTGAVLVYENKMPEAKVGDKVTVTGEVGTYQSVKQVASPVVTVVSSGNSVEHPEPETIDGPAMDNYKGAKVAYVKYTGILVKDGNFYNVNVPGASTVSGSISYPVQEIDSYIGKNVTVEGYYMNITNQGKSFATVLVSITEAGGSYFAVSPLTIYVNASATTAEIDVTANVAWTAVSETEGFTVSPASGSASGKITVSFAANETDADRTAVIKVSTTDSSIEIKEYTVNITQEAKPAEAEYPFTSNVKWTLGEKSYSEKVIIGGAEYDALKLGTSGGVGSATLTIPAGTKKVGFYGVAWNGKKGSITVKMGDTEVYSKAFISNTGAANNSPYTLSVTGDDYYEMELPSALEADTDVTVSTVAGQTRVILFGINAY